VNGAVLDHEIRRRWPTPHDRAAVGRLQPGEELVIDDVIRTLFGLGQDPTGQMVILGPEIVVAQWRAAAIGNVAGS